MQNQVEQLHKIFKLCGSPSEAYWKKSKLPHATIFKPQQSYRRCIAETFKHFPPSSLPLIDTLLAIDPADRQTATAALRSEVSIHIKTRNPFHLSITIFVSWIHFNMCHVSFCSSL